VGKTLLLAVDDDADIRQVLKANLELYGFELDLAESWSKGQAALGRQLPSLIILDLTLPDGDGIEICKDLKQQYPKIPVIMLTAKDRVPDKVIGLESGADDYIVKPFETIELLARIRACLRRYVPSVEKITIDGLVVDLKTRVVSLQGKAVELTPKEYDLLCLFLTNRGEPLRREFIRKTVWKDSQIYSWSRVIDVHIQHLRQKIEANPLEPEYLLTVPGVGYKFKQ
jgi:DNA-binding response OmpR family regulator